MKSIDFAIRKTAQDLGIPEEKAKVVVMEYWGVIYKKLLTGSNSAVSVRHLGTFAISRFKLNLWIRNKIYKIRRIKATPKLTDEKKTEIIDEDMKRLKLALKHRNDIAWQYAKNFKNV